MKRAHARRLYGGSIGHRIGERHAELDHIGSGGRQRLRDRKRSLGIGIARRDEGHQRGAAFALERGEAFVDAGGHAEFLFDSSSLRFSSRSAAMRTFAVPSIRQMLMPAK